MTLPAGDIPGTPAGQLNRPEHPLHGQPVRARKRQRDGRLLVELVLDSPRVRGYERGGALTVDPAEFAGDLPGAAEVAPAGPELPSGRVRLLLLDAAGEAVSSCVAQAAADGGRLRLTVPEGCAAAPGEAVSVQRRRYRVESVAGLTLTCTPVLE